MALTKSIVSLLTICSISTTTVACDQIGSLLDRRPSDVKLCEVTLIDRLKSPSSYSYVGHTVAESELTIDKYLRNLFPKLKMPWRSYQDQRSVEDANLITDTAAQANSPVFRYIQLQYDAANSYGAVIRDVETCISVSGDGNPVEFSRFDMTVWQIESSIGRPDCCLLQQRNIQ